MGRDSKDWIHLHRAKLIVIACLLILVVICAGLFFHFFYPSRGMEPVKVVIEEGDSTAVIAEKLRESEVITSELLFRLLAWLQGRQGKFKPGFYSLNTGMHYGEVFSILEEGPNMQARLTIPEGLTVHETAEKVARVTPISVEDFCEAASLGDYDVAHIPDANQDDLEGFLFPKTYDIEVQVGARYIVEMLLDQFNRETEDLVWSQAEQLGISDYEAVIVASLIEREAAVDDERSLVAAVIYNRLKTDMLLQIDATVQYALPQWKESLTYEDLRIPSSYNTYLNKGLPPTPICSPGLASIKAALNPAQVDYLYYVATGDGRHFFTSDYDEFLRVKEEVQR
jgi:UPF0755 protein